MENCLEGKCIHRLERLTSLDQLELLRPEWAELWGRCPSATPFQSPDWLIAWWRHLGQGELWVLALRDETHLRAVAPFVITEAPVSCQRQLLLLGTGISDYLDLLIEPEFESVAAEAILSYLDSHHDSWDVGDFQQLPGTSALLALETLPGWKSQITVQEVCPVLRLPSDEQELPAYVPLQMMAKLRYYRKRAEKAAPTQVEAVDADNFQDLFESLLRLHQARWGARGQNGVLADERLKEFHREVARRFLARGALRLYGLRVGAETVASLYAFSHRRRSFYYLGGFKPEFAPLSPGTLMIGYAIEQAIQEGAAEFDFLRGREAYKYLWGARGRLNYRRQFRHAAAVGPNTVALQPMAGRILPH